MGRGVGAEPHREAPGQLGSRGSEEKTWGRAFIVVSTEGTREAG